MPSHRGPCRTMGHLGSILSTVPKVRIRVSYRTHTFSRNPRPIARALNLSGAITKLEQNTMNTMEQLWGMPWSGNGAYHEAALGHAMEQQWGIPWSGNGAYHEATIKHTMERQWGMPWGSNEAYPEAAMGHAMEQ